jgi:hypothetical protein
MKVRTVPMITILGVFLLATPGRVSATQVSARESAGAKTTTAAIGNEDVVKMVKAGLDEAVVIAAIRKAKATRFIVTPEALVSLKNGGVSNGIIAAMLDPSSPPPAPAAAFHKGGSPDPDDPMAPHESGIYFDSGTERPRLVALESSAFAQTKSGGLFKSAMTMGIKKMNWKAVLRVPRASRRLSGSKTATFYFYFDQKSSSLGAGAGAATSPNEFVLARMEAKKDSRELIVGQLGAFGNNMGPRSQDMIQFKVEPLAPGSYRVTPTETLKPGEYCFFPTAGGSMMGLGGGRLFDFGVD